MSVENLKSFLRKVNEDEEAKNRVKKLAEESNPNTALCNYGQELGFDFNEEDIKTFNKQVLASGEITEEDLSNVSGGGNKYTPYISIMPLCF